MNKQSTVSKVLKLRLDSIEGWADARESAKTCINYINNKQFTDEEISKADTNVKPLLTYNILVAKLNVLLGNEQLSRRIAKILPQYSDDENVVRILSDNWEHIIEKEHLEKKMVLALADALICATGGWIRRKIKLDDMGYLEFCYDILDSLDEVHPDPDFRRYDLMDAKYVAIDGWMTRDDIIVEWGKSDFDDKTEWWHDVLPNLFDVESKKEGGDYRRGAKYLVTCLEERIVKPVNIIQVDGEYFRLTDEEIKKQFPDAGIQYIKKDKDIRIKTTTIIPELDFVLEEKVFSFPTKRFSVFPCFSFDYNMTKSSQTSLIELLRTPQDRINKGASQRVDYITQMLGKQTYIPAYEKEAMRILQEGKGDPNLIVPLTSMKNKPMKNEDINIPPALFEEPQHEKAILYDISGINPAMEGVSERSGESGVLYQQKLSQGFTSTNPFFENLAYTRELVARDYVELAPFVYYEEDRLLPVKNNNALSYELVNLKYEGEIEKDIRNVKARVILDDAENTPDRIQKTFEQNIAFTNMLIAAGAQFNDIPWEAIIKHSRFRDKEEWIKFLNLRQQMLQNMQDSQRADEEVANQMALAQQIMPQQPPQQGRMEK